MILELGTIAESRLLAVARANDGPGLSLLRGAGWGGVALAVEPIEEHRVEHGPDALDRCAALLDRVGEPTNERGWNGGRPLPRWIGYLAYEAARSLERPAWSRNETRPAPIGAAMLLRRYA